MFTLALFFGFGLGRVVDPEWKEVGKANSLEPVNVLLVLKRDPAVLAKLEAIFWETSDPDHENYGKFLTQDEVTKLMSISDEHLNAVTSVLKQNGGDFEVGVHRDLITARLGVPQVEKLFGTSLYKYQHSRRGTHIVRAKMGTEITMPKELEDVVEYVDNLSSFPRLTTPKKVSLDNNTDAVFPATVGCPGVNANIAVTPKVLAMRYKTNGPLTYVEGKAASMSVGEFQGQMWSQSQQLDKFNYYCQMNATVDRQIGTNTPSVCDGDKTACTESQLDIEYIRAVAGDVHLTDVYSGDYSLLNWAQTLENMPDDEIPQVNSVSYGDDEGQNYQSYMESCNTEFQKLAVRGVSVLFAAGDQGVWGREGVGNGNEFHPDFPAGSPYVTAVGGTDFAVAGVIGEEKAWSDGGGGFSDVFPIPSYQADVVAKYKQMNGLPYSGLYNQNGRGYPDVAALAGTQNPYLIYSNSKFEGVGGTSAATPVVSGIIAKLNVIRLGQGKATLGFLNPWLYKNADCFNDVTLGNNGSFEPGSGFPALEGWDAATGLGTPNFECLSTRV